MSYLRTPSPPMPHRRTPSTHNVPPKDPPHAPWTHTGAPLSAPPPHAPPKDPLTLHAPPKDPLTLHAPPKDPLTLLAPPKDPLNLHAAPKDPLTLLAPPKDPLMLRRRTLSTPNVPPKDPLTLHAPPKDPITLDAPPKDPITLHAPPKDPLTLHAPTKDPLTLHAPPKDSLTLHVPPKDPPQRPPPPPMPQQSTPSPLLPKTGPDSKPPLRRPETKPTVIRGPVATHLRAQLHASCTALHCMYPHMIICHGHAPIVGVFLLSRAHRGQIPRLILSNLNQLTATGADVRVLPWRPGRRPFKAYASTAVIHHGADGRERPCHFLLPDQTAHYRGSVSATVKSGSFDTPELIGLRSDFPFFLRLLPPHPTPPTLSRFLSVCHCLFASVSVSSPTEEPSSPPPTPLCVSVSICLCLSVCPSVSLTPRIKVPPHPCWHRLAFSFKAGSRSQNSFILFSCGPIFFYLSSFNLIFPHSSSTIMWYVTWTVTVYSWF